MSDRLVAGPMTSSVQTARSTLRVLVAGEKLVAGTVFARLLEQAGFHAVGQACSIGEVLRLAEGLRPDLILMDLESPALDGIAATTAIMEGCPTPIVLLAASSDQPMVRRALEVGAVGYLVDPVHAAQLNSGLFAAMEQFRQRQISEDRIRALEAERDRTLQANEEFRRLALTDALTGVANRRALYQLLNAEISRARRYRRPLILLYVDIDDFKLLNDQLGHSIGDHILREVAREMRESLRDCDVVARLGGDEFVLLFPETTVRDAEPILVRLQQRLDALANREGLRLEFSTGIVPLDSQTVTADEALRQGDDAMYAVKRAKRRQAAFEAGEAIDGLGLE